MFSWFKKETDEYKEMLDFILESNLNNIYRRVEYNCTLHVTGVDCASGIQELYTEAKYMMPKQRNFRQWFLIDNKVIPNETLFIDYVNGLKYRYTIDKSQIMKNLIRSIYNLIEELEYGKEL